MKFQKLLELNMTTNYKDVISQLPGIFYSIDSNNKVICCNRAFEDMLFNIFNVKLINSVDLTTIFSKNSELLFDKNAPLNDEISILDHNIQQTYSLFRVNTQIEKNHCQNIQLFNISRRKSTEKQIIDSDHMNYSIIHEIISKIQGSVYWKNKKGIYLGCNETQAKILGFRSPKDVIGKTDYELPWPKGSADDFRKNDEHVMETKKTIVVEEIATVDGHESYVLSTKAPLLDSDQECIGIIGTSVNIGNIKEAQNKLKEAKILSDEMSKSKSEFIAALNNDLRTQMNVISMSLGGIEHLGIRDEYRVYYNAIEDAINEMSPILEYAESYAKLDLDTEEYPTNYFDPLPYINSNIDMLYSKFIATDSDIYVDLSQYESCDIYSTQINFDKVIKIVLSYIASISENSINIIEIDSLKLKGTDNLIIKFLIPNSTVKSEFIKENLYAVKNDDNHISMSLIYCKKLIEDMDGTIDVNDVDNHGVEICLYLPSKQLSYLESVKSDDAIGDVAILDNIESRAIALDSHLKNYDRKKYIIQNRSQLDKKVNDILKHKYIVLDGSLLKTYYDVISPMIHQSQNNNFIIYADENRFDKENNLNLKNVRKLNKHVRHDVLEKTIRDMENISNTVRNKVLIVEDSKLLRHALNLNFDVLGYDTDLVSNGEDAIELVKTNDYYAAFLDIGLPGINGLNTAEIIKSIKPDLRLIALTGLTLSIDIDKLWDSGLFKDVLKKPAPLSMLELLLDDLGTKDNVIDL